MNPFPTPFAPEVPEKQPAEGSERPAWWSPGYDDLPDEVPPPQDDRP